MNIPEALELADTLLEKISSDVNARMQATGQKPDFVVVGRQLTEFLMQAAMYNVSERILYRSPVTGELVLQFAAGPVRVLFAEADSILTYGYENAYKSFRYKYEP